MSRLNSRVRPLPWSTFHELTKKYHRVPRIPRSEVRPLWSTGHYDGPASGIVRFRDRLHGAKALDWDWTGPSRRFFLIWMSDEEIASESEWHNWYQERCGFYTTFDVSGNRGKPKQHGVLSSWLHQDREFYERYCRRNFQPSGHVVGWFQSWRPVTQAGEQS